MKRWNLAICGLMSLVISPELRSQPPDAVGSAKIVPSGLPDLLETLTSFGGAIVGNVLYIYGGHTGSAHSYSVAEQSDRFYSLSLTTPSATWQQLASGPRLQGLALVPYGRDVIRIGGFTAINEEGEDHDLRSQASVSRFEVSSGRWTSLPPLPEPRSSHDAAVLGNHVYAVGGWHLNGDQETVWHSTAWKLDLDTAGAQWKPIAKPPTMRRALSLAAFNGSLFAIGGMTQKAGPTTMVEVYDPAQDIWSPGPALPGDPMNGFGSSAFATGGSLYVTTIHGNALRLSASGQDWTSIAQVDPPRFFHRMLPIDDTSLLIVGGANMEEGKFTEIERMNVR